MDDQAVILLINGLRLALEEKASAVTKEHVIRALNLYGLAIPPPTGGPYVPSPKTELPLAQDILSVITELGGIDSLTGESLRAALEPSR